MANNLKAASLCVSLLVLGSALAVMAAPNGADQQTTLAMTPPMGWNSWDGYGTTINEVDFKANADWLFKHLKAYGWEYVVVDADWFVANPVAEGNSKKFEYVMDGYGRYMPSTNRFPSAANDTGFKPLADYVHSLGLKFGIHILRGIPKQAVERNLPIAGSAYHAADAADTSDTCPWNYDNYGIDGNKPGGQAYYDSIAKLYASWGVDLIKADCISSRPYKGDEIRMLSAALRKTGSPIVLSLSPGAAPLEKAEELRQYAQMWRISDDVWDLWHSDEPFPQGVANQFANAAKWASMSGPGHWPDADMLPIGRLGPAPGWEQPRNSRLTHDEQRTMVTLWSIFRSPLMVGGDLTAADDWTTALLTNPEVIAVDQHSTKGHAVITNDRNIAWLAKPATGTGYYLAVFNITAQPQKVQYAWKELSLNGAEYKLRDLWQHKDLVSGKSIDVTLPSHGCALYRLLVQ